jgi:hypothetical protein
MQVTKIREFDAKSIRAGYKCLCGRGIRMVTEYMVIGEPGKTFFLGSECSELTHTPRVRNLIEGWYQAAENDGEKEADWNAVPF